jgi:hypothetical protein
LFFLNKICFFWILDRSLIDCVVVCFCYKVLLVLYAFEEFCCDCTIGCYKCFVPCDWFVHTSLLFAPVRVCGSTDASQKNVVVMAVSFAVRRGSSSSTFWYSWREKSVKFSLAPNLRNLLVLLMICWSSVLRSENFYG